MQGTACGMQYNFVVNNHLVIRVSKIGGLVTFPSEEISHTLKQAVPDVGAHFSEA